MYSSAYKLAPLVVALVVAAACSSSSPRAGQDAAYYHYYWVAAPTVEGLAAANPARLVGRYLVPSLGQAFGHGSVTLGPDGVSAGAGASVCSVSAPGSRRPRGAVLLGLMAIAGMWLGARRRR